jgi:hypothetical protein
VLLETYVAAEPASHRAALNLLAQDFESVVRGVVEEQGGGRLRGGAAGGLRPPARIGFAGQGLAARR